MNLNSTKSAGLMIPVLLIISSQLITASLLTGKDDAFIAHSPILGIWKCTPETALQFPEGILEPVIQIREDRDHRLTAQGCFLWNGLYYDQWEIKEIHYNETTATLSFTDGDNSVFTGILNIDFQMILKVGSHT